MDSDHLGWPWKEIAHTLKPGVEEGLGGKGDDQPLVSQTRQVLYHAIHLVLWWWMTKLCLQCSRMDCQAPHSGDDMQY